MATNEKSAPGSDRHPPTWLVLLNLPVVSVVVVVLMVSLVRAGLESKRESSPVPGGIETTGTVLSVREDDGSNSKSAIYSARIRFTDENGTVHTFTKNAGGEEPDPGSKVRVSYDPRDPSVARDLTTNADIWKYQLLPAAVLGPLVVVVDVVLVVAFVRRRRKRADEAPASAD